MMISFQVFSVLILLPQLLLSIGIFYSDHKCHCVKNVPFNEKERKVPESPQCNVIHYKAQKKLQLVLPVHVKSFPVDKKETLLLKSALSAGISLVSTGGDLGEERRLKKDFSSSDFQLQ